MFFCVCAHTLRNYECFQVCVPGEGGAVGLLFAGLPENSLRWGHEVNDRKELLLFTLMITASEHGQDEAYHTHITPVKALSQKRSAVRLIKRKKEQKESKEKGRKEGGFK